MRCVYLFVQMNIGRCYLRLITVMSYYQCQASFVLLVLWVLSFLQAKQLNIAVYYWILDAYMQRKNIYKWL